MTFHMVGHDIVVAKEIHVICEMLVNFRIVKITLAKLISFRLGTIVRELLAHSTQTVIDTEQYSFLESTRLWLVSWGNVLIVGVGVDHDHAVNLGAELRQKWRLQHRKMYSHVVLERI